MDRGHWIVRGRVQGVGFRWWTQRTAERLGLEGWVRNRSDGSVELAARGAPGALVALREALEEGPSGARVEEVRAVTDGGGSEPGPVGMEGGDGFRILR
ncbi:MAG: acylphosphatase [Longimicrobiales bacterium]